MSNVLVAAEGFKIELSEGLIINGEVKALEDGASKPVLLISHGFKGHKDWGFWPYVSAWFAERGFYTVSFDFSRIAAKQAGFDEIKQAEASTLSQEIADIQTVFEQIQRRQLPLTNQADADKIALLGHSRSGGSNLIFAAEQPEVRAVAVWNGGARANPPSGVNDGAVSLQQAAIQNDQQANAERFDIPRQLASLQIPAFIVQGEQDSERLLESNQFLRKAAPNQSFVNIPGADHTFGIVHPFSGTTVFLEEVLEATLTFLNNSFQEE